MNTLKMHYISFDKIGMPPLRLGRFEVGIGINGALPHSPICHHIFSCDEWSIELEWLDIGFNFLL